MGLISRVSSRTYRDLGMRFIAVLGLVLLVGTVFSLETAKAAKSSIKKCNKSGYWGDNCSKLCGHCAGGKACNKVNGKCPGDGACEEGWTDEKAGQHKCDLPKCFGDLGCDHEGECIAPNYCKCSGGGAMGQVVGVAGLYADEAGAEVEGIQCISLRLDGLKGFFIALAVLIVSISTCGFVANKKLLADKM